MSITDTMPKSSPSPPSCGEGRPMADPTPADRLAMALCADRWPSLNCRQPCHSCRQHSAAVARELAQILRERHGGSSSVADWLDGVGCHG